MNNQNDKKIEEIIEKTLEYIDSGKSFTEILGLFPEYEATLKEIFSAINLLKKEREAIVPSEELLKQIIEQIPVDVTSAKNYRYIYANEKGRMFKSVKIIDLISSMSKVYIGVGVFVLVLVVVGGVYWQKKIAVSPLEQNLTFEEKALDKSNAEIEEMANDAPFDNLEKDLTAATGKINLSSIENMESELAFELNSFSGDSNDLSGFESDASFDALESGLSNATE